MHLVNLFNLLTVINSHWVCCSLVNWQWVIYWKPWHPRKILTNGTTGTTWTQFEQMWRGVCLNKNHVGYNFIIRVLFQSGPTKPLVNVLIILTGLPWTPANLFFKMKSHWIFFIMLYSCSQIMLSQGHLSCNLTVLTGRRRNIHLHSVQYGSRLSWLAV